MPTWLDRLRGRATPSTAIVLASAAPPAHASPHAPDRGIVFGPPSSAQMSRDDASDRKKAQANVVSVFAEASRGRTARLSDFCKSVRRYDSRLDAVARMRVLAVTGRPRTVKPAVGYENDGEAKRVALEIRRLIDETRGFTTLVGHLAGGSLETHSVLEHRWNLNARGLWATAPVWRHGNRFGWGPDEKIAKVDPGVDLWPGVPLAEFPWKFVVHAPVGGSSDYPWNRGALRSRIAPSLMKRFGVAWWLQLLERFGQPQLYANQEDGDTNGDAIVEALRKMGVDWRAVFPKGVEPKAIPFTLNSDLHRNFVDWQNTEDAIALLGQNLSTEVKGGSYAAALAQERVRADILAADLMELDETITDQWIAALVHFNWPGAPVPYIEHGLTARESFQLAELQAGVCSIDQYLEGKGRDPLPGGRGSAFISAPAALPADAPPGLDVDPASKPADTALNGAQVSSLLDIVTQAASGLIPRETAIEIITSAFPIDRAKAEAILGSVGNGFVPANPDAPGGAPADLPFAPTATAMPPSSTTSSTTGKASTPTSTPSSRNPIASSLSRR